MNYFDSEKVQKLEQAIIDARYKKSIAEVDNFPFNSYDNFKEAYFRSDIKLYVDLDQKVFDMISSKLSVRSIMIYNLFVFSIPIISIYLSFHLNNYYYLISIPMSIAGYTLTSPFFIYRKHLRFLSLLITVFMIYDSNYLFAFCSGAFFISIWLGILVRNIYQFTFISSLMKSESILIYFLELNILHIKNNENASLLDIMSS